MNPIDKDKPKNLPDGMYRVPDWLNWLNGIELGGGIGGRILCWVDESISGGLLCCPIILECDGAKKRGI